MAEITEQVAASGDDGYCQDSSIYTNTTLAAFGNYSGSANNAFFRFTGVDVAQGASISTAKLQFKASGDYSTTTCNVNIYFEDADDPNAPTTVSDYNGRSLTGAIAWSSIGSWTTGTWYDSPEIASILQTVINRPGWVSGQDIIAYVKNNTSSSGAYRAAKTRDAGASEGAKLVFTYGIGGAATDGSKIGETVTVVLTSEQVIADSGSISDAVDGQSNSEFLTDAAALGDAIDALSFGGYLTDGAGISDEISSAGTESTADAVDGAGISDAIAGGYEKQAAAADGCGLGDAADAFNWTDWIAENLDKSIVRYYCTITGDADGTTDIEIPISSFQARKQNGNATYLSVVIPGVAYADQIDARSNGDIVIDMAYLIDGTESQREEIVRAELEQINIQEGPNSRSISLIGHKDQTFVAKESRLYDPIYKARTDGALSYRFAVPDLWLNPGDTAQVDDDEFTVDTVIYMVSAGGQTTMEVQESA